MNFNVPYWAYALGVMLAAVIGWFTGSGYEREKQRERSAPDDKGRANTENNTHE